MVKRKHQLLTESERDQILAIPTDRDHLARLYSFEPSDIDIIGARRERRNRLGVALQLALLRHPGTTLAQIIRDTAEQVLSRDAVDRHETRFRSLISKM